MAQSFNLQSALAALQNAPPDVKQKAADMMAQYGGAQPTTQEQPGWLQTPQIAPNAPPQGNPAFGNVSDILANYDAMQNPPQQQDSTLIQPPYGQGMPSPDQPAQVPAPQTPAQYSGFTPFGQQAPGPRFIQPRTSAPTTLADQTQSAEEKYRAAVLAPKPKTHWWQNALAISGQIAANVFNPQNQVPVRSWGQIKHDAAIKNAAATLQPLAQLQDAATQDAFKKAQADWYSGRNPTTLAATQERMQGAQNVATIKDAGLTTRSSDRDLVRLYTSNPTFDATDPANADLVAAVKNRLNVTLPTKTGKTKTDLRFDEKTGQGYIFSKDDAGNVEIHKALDDDGQPVVLNTTGMVSSEDKAKQRELSTELAKQRNITAIRVADIGAGSREKVANINQQGATGRNDANIKSREQIAQENRDATTQYHKDVQRLGQTKADASHLANFIRTYMNLHGQEPSSALQDQFLEGLRGAVSPTPVTKAQDTANTVINALPPNLRP